MFIPALSPNFELDHQLLPYAQQLCQGILISTSQLNTRRFKALYSPVWLDSGGYSALEPHAQVIEKGGLGILKRPMHPDLTPQSVKNLADELEAEIEFTLDFPSREKQHFTLNEANALWRLRQKRNRAIYACVQPEQELTKILEANPDGIALGGLVPLLHDRTKVTQEISRVRKTIPENMPLHVFGLGHPDLIELALKAGATSTDSSGPQRLAVSGKSYSGQSIQNPSNAERLYLAVQNLQASLKASGEKSSLTPNLFLNLPTGAGKTYRAAREVRSALQRPEDKAIITAPTVALVDEIQREWQERFPELNITAYTHAHAYKKPYRHAQVIVTTPERLDILTSNWRKHSWLGNVKCLVIDEFHLINDPHRGAALEQAITRSKLIMPLSRLLILTATCGNPKQISQWLTAEHIYNDKRPVTLEWETITTNHKEVQLWEKLNDIPTIIFVHSRARATSLAEQACKRGFQAAAHHAGLGMEQRREIEAKYRAGRIKLLFATPTLALGVNLNAQHIILADLTLPRLKALSINEAWQRAGRAGRIPGEAGKITVIGNKKERAERYLTPDFEALQGQISRNAERFILTAIHGGFAKTDEQLHRLYQLTLSAQQTPETAQRVISKAINELRHYQGIEEKDGTYSLTRYGHAAQQSCLSISVIHLVTHLPADPYSFDLILYAISRLTPLKIQEKHYVLLQITLDTVASRSLDKKELFGQETLLTAAALWLSCHDHDEEAPLHLSTFETDLIQKRQEVATILQAWATLSKNPKIQLCAVMMISGLSLQGATLTMLRGIGTKNAKALQHSGIEDIEMLATLTTDDPELSHLKAEKAARLIQQAEHLVKTFDHDITLEPQHPGRELNLKGHIDPARLLRAAQLQVTPQIAGFIVTGGHAPHQVTSQGCDCPDWNPYRPCKHVLAVKLYQQDPDTVHNLWMLK